jgi:hypothetical protein
MKSETKVVQTVLRPPSSKPSPVRGSCVVSLYHLLFEGPARLSRAFPDPLLAPQLSSEDTSPFDFHVFEGERCLRREYPLTNNRNCLVHHVYTKRCLNRALLIP